MGGTAVQDGEVVWFPNNCFRSRGERSGSEGCCRLQLAETEKMIRCLLVRGEEEKEEDKESKERKKMS